MSVDVKLFVSKVSDSNRLVGPPALNELSFNWLLSVLDRRAAGRVVFFEI